MSYICGRGGVTSTDTADQPVDQPERYGAVRTATAVNAFSFVPDLYPSRPLGQRLTDRLLVGLIFLPVFAAVLATRQDQKAGVR